MSLLWDISLIVTHPSWRVVHIYKPVQKDITRWPASIKKEFGSVLTRLQKGEEVGLPDVRPMSSVGSAVAEIRVADGSGEYRAFFILWTGKAMSYIPHPKSA